VVGVELVTFRLRFDIYCGSFARNLEQVAKLRAQVNSASFPPGSRGWNMSSNLRATGRRPGVPDWGGGMSDGCTAGPTVRFRG